jgi:hypothetical protein
LLLLEAALEEIPAGFLKVLAVAVLAVIAQIFKVTVW